MKLIVALSLALAACLSFGQAKPLPGSNGVIGTPVRVGRYLFILTSASFTHRFVREEGYDIAPSGKKLLLLNFTVQNPSKGEIPFNWGSIHFTVVGADADNFENKNYAVHPDKLTSFNLDLKPAQKVPVVMVVEVPANDPVFKLMVQSEESPVVRYDLRGKVKKYVGPFAAGDGITLKDSASLKLGEKAELGPFDFVVEKLEEVTSPIGDHGLEEGQKFFVATVAFTNVSKGEVDLNWGTYVPTMADTNGEPLDFQTELLRGVGNTSLSMAIAPGQTIRGRYLFRGPAEAKAATLKLQLNEVRAVEVALK